MPQSGLVSAVRAVDWCNLRSTYGSGEIVRDIVLSLASRDETEVKWAWEHIGETVLQHQGTVYRPPRQQLRSSARSPWMRRHWGPRLLQPIDAFFSLAVTRPMVPLRHPGV